MTYFSMIPTEVLDAIGVGGFGLYVTNYLLLTCNKLTSDQATYFSLNLIASSMVLISLTGAFNLASAMIQVFWIVISVVAIMMRLNAGSTATDQP